MRYTGDDFCEVVVRKWDFLKMLVDRRLNMWNVYEKNFTVFLHELHSRSEIIFTFALYWIMLAVVSRSIKNYGLYCNNLLITSLGVSNTAFNLIKCNEFRSSKNCTIPYKKTATNKTQCIEETKRKILLIARKKN